MLGEPLSHHGIVKLHWKMQHTVTNAIDSYGSDVLLLAPDDRVLVDYQFLEPRPAGA